jgi:flagellar hook-basal body complex protein FliE
MAITSIPSININPINPLEQTNRKSGANALDQVGKTFGDMLNSLNDSQLEADNLTQKLATGQEVDLHQVMLSAEENDVNFKVAMAIRDKLVDAYREVMRMSV